MTFICVEYSQYVCHCLHVCFSVMPAIFPYNFLCLIVCIVVLQGAMIDVRYSSLDEVRQYRKSQLFLRKSIWVGRNGLAVRSYSTLCMISQSFLTVC
jgi:hypothetical protein